MLLLLLCYAYRTVLNLLDNIKKIIKFWRLCVRTQELEKKKLILLLLIDKQHLTLFFRSFSFFILHFCTNLNSEEKIPKPKGLLGRRIFYNKHLALSKQHRALKNTFDKKKKKKKKEWWFFFVNINSLFIIMNKWMNTVLVMQSNKSS